MYNPIRHYYAVTAPYGVRTVFDNYNPATVYVFDSREQRAAFLKYKDPIMYSTITRREADRVSKPDERLYAVPDGCIIDDYGRTIDHWRRFACPDCSDPYDSDKTVALEALEWGRYTCPQCGRVTVSPADDGAWIICE